MIQLIVGNKGTGKTKTMVELVNQAVEASNGSVVCVEKGLKLTYDISHKARLVDAEEYKLAGFDALSGFLCGLMAGNYDITDVFVDATLKIGGKDLEMLATMIQKLNGLSTDHKVRFVFTISADKADLPAVLKEYML